MKIKLFNKILYPPVFLSLPSAGVEICNNCIKYVELYNLKGTVSLKKFGEVPLSANIIKDGDILNKNSLVKALIEVKKNITSNFVKVSIPEEKTYIFDVEIPKEAKKNIREALEFKIEENVPLKLEEVSFEYEELKNSKNNSNNISVNVSVIPKSIIDDYTEVLNQADIYPVAFEVESKVIADAVISKKDRNNYIIVKIKENSTVLIAVIDGIVRFSSSIGVGEYYIKEKLFKTDLFKDKPVDYDFFSSDFSFDAAYTSESYDAVVSVFSVFKDEVEKFNGYVEDKFFNADQNIKSIKNNKIEKIILCGKCAVLPGLAKHINQNMNAEIILANAWINVFDISETPPQMKFNDSLNFITPIGLVVSSYKQL
jgi:type IV pilus assembly protein PilM